MFLFLNAFSNPLFLCEFIVLFLNNVVNPGLFGPISFINYFYNYYFSGLLKYQINPMLLTISMTHVMMLFYYFYYFYY